MNKEFISAALQEAIYQRKEGTESSFYWQEGSRILPNRASISKIVDITKVSRKGRMLLHPSIGQLISRFTKGEESPLKMYKPYNLRTQIWKHEGYPQFIGWGTIGISNSTGGIVDTNDLIILYTEDEDWRTIRIFFFRGMGNPDLLEEAMRFASSIINNKP